MIPAVADRTRTGAWSAAAARAGRSSRAMSSCSPSRVVVVYVAERHGTPAQHAAGLAGGRTWRARSCASASPTRRCGRRHDGHLVRRGQRRVRVADRHRRARPDGQPGATARVVFGGVGTGLYTMLLFVLLAVFIGGLMVGRTPEYLGKKIEAREIKLVVARRCCSRRWRCCSAPALGDRPPSTAAPSIFASGPQGFSRDALRLPVAGQQQRLGVRRLHRLLPARRPATSARTASRSPTCSAA